MGNYKRTLLIGCGGSGIETLTRLNQLLSSNPNYRNDLRENVSYLVVDTARADLTAFKTDIRSQMGGIEPPTVAVAHISEGLREPSKIVKDVFGNLEGEAEEKMKGHWLHSPEGEPFRLLHIQKVEQGAGQCCQLSYLSAWRFMPEFERVLQELWNEILTKNPGEDNTDIQVFLVAGVAGGTGRGSWQLIAFKVRQFFEEQNIPVNITGVFFEVSCFKERLRTAKPEERENMIVNSYTGMSELSGWLRLKKAPQFYYSLPYLDNPGSNVISVSEEEEETKQSPVFQAFLVFGSNGLTGDLLNRHQYFEMAATALYSLVVYHDVIDPIISNRRMNIGSFGATTFEVDTYHLRSFFETAVQKHFIETQCAELTEDGPAVAEADEVIGGMFGPDPEDPEKKTFLTGNDLWLPESFFAKSDYVSLEVREEDKILSLIQKFVKEKIIGSKISKVERKLKNKDKTETAVKEFAATKNLREFLEKNAKPDTINTMLKSALELPRMDEAGLSADLDELLAEFNLDREHLTKTLDDKVLEQFAPEGKNVSLGRSIHFTAKLKECFEKYIEVLNAGILVQGGKENCTKIDDVVALLKGSIKTAYEVDNGFLGMGDKFQPKEIESICSQFQYCMYAAIFFKLKPVLIEFYQRAADRLEEIGLALERMVNILKGAAGLVDKSFEKVFGKLSYDAIIDKYFVDPVNLASIASSIPAAGALTNVFYRQLKPIMTRVEIEELLRPESGNVRVDKKAVLEEVGKELRALLAINTDSDTRRFYSVSEAEASLPKELCDVILTKVHLQEKIGRTSFMEKYFSFKKVLDNNITCWNKLLQESSADDIPGLRDRFKGFLGVNDQDYDENRGTLERGHVLEKIVLSLVRTCKPWIQIRTDSLRNTKEALDCSVLLPLTVDKPDALEENIKKSCRVGALTVEATVKCPGENNNELNLPSDRIVVFNAEFIEDDDFAPMDKVSNLTEWKRDSALNGDLLLAEDVCEGKSAWFEYDTKLKRWAQKQRGMTYVSPIFLAEPFKSLRWHPWLKETSVSMEEARRARAHRALYYAFLGNGVDDPAVKASLAAFNCENPLLSMNPKQDFFFNYQRRAWNGVMMEEPSRVLKKWDTYFLSSKAPTEEHSASIAFHSIDHVVDYLCGKGDTKFQADGGNNFSKSKELGEALCDELNNEADVFYENIFGKLSTAEKKELVGSLYDWLTERVGTSTSEDKEYWEHLQEFAGKENERLGVVLV